MVYLSPQPIVAASAFRPAPPPTLAAAIAAVETWHDIPPKPRITKISALRLLERIYDKPPEAIRLDPAELARRLLKTSPKALGLKPGSLSVYKTHIRAVLRRLGLIERPRRRKKPLMPEWQALLEGLPDKFISARLQGLHGLVQRPGYSASRRQ